MPPRSLFPENRPTLRPRAVPNPAAERRAPLSRVEIAPIRAALLEGRDEVACPRCGTVTRVAPPVRNATTGAYLWFVHCRRCTRRVTIRAYPEGHPDAPKFNRLVASGSLEIPDRRSLFGGIGGGIIPLGMVAIIVIATGRSPSVETVTRVDTSLVMLAYDDASDTKGNENPLTRSAPPAPAVPTLPSVPVVVPVSLPVDVGVDLPVTVGETVFDPRQYGRYQTDASAPAGHHASTNDNGHGESRVTTKVFRVAVVDEPPVYLSGPSLRYPRLLREAQIEGYVVLEFVLDAAGRPDSSSIVAIFATNSAFVRSAIAVVAQSFFRPARLQGRPVPVLVEQNVEFSLASRSK